MEQVKNKKNYSYIEYLLLTFIILWSGGSFTYGQFINWSYIMFFVSAFFLIRRHQRVENYNLMVIAVFSVVLLIQTILFRGSITSVAALIMRFLTIGIIAVILRPCFNQVYIKIIAFFAFFSLLFWFIDLIPIGHIYLLNFAKTLPQFGGDILSEVEHGAWGSDRYTVYFYTVSESYINSDYYAWARNSGPFFEPGRFTIFLSIALSLLLFNNNYKQYRKTFYLLLAANITTFSTTGYFVMILLFSCYYIGRSKYANVNNFIMLIIVFIVAYIVMQASFMGEKINIALGDTDNSNSRFGAALYHWTQIVKSPFVGYGIYLEKSFSELEMSPCGITLMMRQWGIPIFFFCVLLMFKGTRSFLVNNIFFRLSFVFILLILAYTQSIMDNPIYYLFYLIGTKKYNYEKFI